MMMEMVRVKICRKTGKQLSKESLPPREISRMTEENWLEAQVMAMTGMKVDEFIKSMDDRMKNHEGNHAN